MAFSDLTPTQQQQVAEFTRDYRAAVVDVVVGPAGGVVTVVEAVAVALSVVPVASNWPPDWAASSAVAARPKSP